MAEEVMETMEKMIKVRKVIMEVKMEGKAKIKKNDGNKEKEEKKKEGEQVQE